MSESGPDWRERAEELARRFRADRFHPAVLEWLRSRENEPLTVACSGGADSLSLLLLVWAHWPEFRRDLLVLHFDHGLRGEASRGDAVFVRAVAEALGVPMQVGRWEKPADETISEERAREARFAFIGDQFAKTGRRVLLLGHQRDDIVETQLMRLSRGSGTAGLAAPRPVHIFEKGRVHLRPLLLLSAEEIRQQLGRVGIPFREDATNAGGDFYRNRLRGEVLPVWQRATTFDVAAGAAASRELLEEDDVALWRWLREIVPVPEAGKEYDLEKLVGRPRALFRRVLQEWLHVEGLGGVFGRSGFSQILGALERGEGLRVSAGKQEAVEIGPGRRVRKIQLRERLLPVFDESWPLPIGGEILLPGGRSISAKVRLLDEKLRAEILGGGVDVRKHAWIAWNGEARLRVRNWEPGDRYRALGAPGRRKLQDMFVDRKICEAERYLLPVVVKGMEIFWVPFFPPAQSVRIIPTSKQVVQLTYDWGKAV